MAVRQLVFRFEHDAKSAFAQAMHRFEIFQVTRLIVVGFALRAVNDADTRVGDRRRSFFVALGDGFVVFPTKFCVLKAKDSLQKRILRADEFPKASILTNARPMSENLSTIGFGYGIT